MPARRASGFSRMCFVGSVGGRWRCWGVTGEEEKGDLILKGSCAACGQAVVRVVETSERDVSGN